MPHYFMLLKATSEGAAHLDAAASYMKDITDSWGVIGGPSAIFMTMGEYDFVISGEAQKDEDVAWLAAQIAKDGWAKPVTMRAFTRDEVVGLFDHPPAEPMKIVRT